MHPYATDSNERERIIAGLALISIGLAWGLDRAWMQFGSVMPWWIGAPSVMGIFWALYKAFDKTAWRWWWIRWLCMIKTPILAGNWRGYVRSSFDEHSTPHEVLVRIRQSWTRMSVVLKSTHSTSISIAGALEASDSAEPVMSYQYRNEPRTITPDTMHIHYGAARLVLHGKNILQGDYFSGRDRQNYGTMRLDKERTSVRPRGVDGSA